MLHWEYTLRKRDQLLKIMNISEPITLSGIKAEDRKQL